MPSGKKLDSRPSGRKVRVTFLQSLEKELVEEYSFITIRFLPPNTTPLIQPMGQQRDFEGFGDEHVSTVDIVSLGKYMNLDMEDDDVEELVGDHNTEPTTEELQDLQREKQLPVTEELFTEEIFLLH
ncbi:hypothetical protein QTO34_009475 [Cnephaeus nilssonii]|uniref:Uncharacterized protein n=1 Tax=Cnephaeus nilssonii TaxID=3371016 RepID=A0AA40HHV0_CNENI|nr:hypothetical protein QTO34_009475 [Eptesicus nilssonii]